MLFSLISAPNPQTLIKDSPHFAKIYTGKSVLYLINIQYTKKLSQNGLQLQISAINYHSHIKINDNEPIWSC